ncbi:hypothetical protein M885DRAFT_625538 [Pelagophyceae sp. CCMP2097]|nr:hypothetical protein M885DRAFT_625538 [Pelagophyceae sp. CCMP2097]
MDGEQGTTHLADRFPQIDTALRVEPPATMKAPDRLETPSRDAQICRSAYSPRAYVMRRTLLAHLAADPRGAERLLEAGSKAARLVPAPLPEPAALGPFKTEVANYHMLAFSSQRAGRLEMEAQAHFALGVLHDNVCQFDVALASYRAFAAVAVKLGDAGAEALAHNCTGVDLMVSACPPSPSSQFGAAAVSPAQRAALEKALAAHADHLRCADEGGRFVASTNLGLCHGALGDALAAARHHQEALRVAIALQSSSGQSIAVGNLGSLAARQGDFATARPCLEQHLQLVQALRDHAAEAHAWMQLGHLAMADDAFDQALGHFEAAASIAEQHRELGLLKRATCYAGVAKGKLTMAEYFKNLAAPLAAELQRALP